MKNAKTKHPQLTVIEFNPRRRNYDFEVVSKNIVDRNITNIEDILWYVSKEEALHYKVKPEDIEYREDDIPEKVNFAYHFEYNLTDHVNIETAKQFDLGVVKYLNGDMKDIEYMYALESCMNPMVSLLCYCYVTHGVLDGELFKEIKKLNTWRALLAFTAKNDLFDEIMSIKV